MPASKVNKIVDFTDAADTSGDNQSSASLDAYFDEVKDAVNEHALDLDVLLRDDNAMQDDILLGHEFSAAAITYLKGVLGNQNAALNWRGTWTQSTDYAIGDLAADTGVSDDVYYCLVAHNSGSAHADLSAYIAANPTHWETFVPGTTIAFPASPNASEVLCRNVGNTANVWKKIGPSNTDGSFAPLASPAITGTATVQNLTVLGGYFLALASDARMVLTPHVYSTLAAGAVGLTVDFSKSPIQAVTNGANTGTITLSSSNLVDGALLELFIAASTGGNRTLVFPAGWRFLGYKPPTLLQNKDACLTLRCVGGATDANVFATWAEEL